MKWQFWVGRILIVVPALLLVLLFLYLAWIGGIFDGYNASEQATANVLVVAALGMCMALGFLFSRYAKWAVATIMGLSLLGLVWLTATDGWSDDLIGFLLVYPVIIFGYWLSRRGRRSRQN